MSRASNFISGLGVGGCLITLLVSLVSFAGWITHLAYCFHHQAWGFLIAGAIAFPIGVIHGWGLWFGWW